jgi:hypothetical protein
LEVFTYSISSLSEAFSQRVSVRWSHLVYACYTFDFWVAVFSEKINEFGPLLYGLKANLDYPPKDWNWWWEVYGKHISEIYTRFCCFELRSAASGKSSKCICRTEE